LCCEAITAAVWLDQHKIVWMTGVTRIVQPNSIAVHPARSQRRAARVVPVVRAHQNGCRTPARNGQVGMVIGVAAVQGVDRVEARRDAIHGAVVASPGWSGDGRDTSTTASARGLIVPLRHRLTLC